MSAERLQKVLARAGVASRRKVEEMIREGRVTIDGRIATVGDHADLEEHAVKVDGKRIAPLRKAHRYILINKPPGCMSTVEDPEGRPTVMHILPTRLRHGLKPVGRLDWGTEGLLLLSDDGDFIYRVAHPRFGCTKTYEVKVKGEPEEKNIRRLREGIVLDGKKTKPAKIRALEDHLGARGRKKNSWWTVTLSEGRNRQIREMFQRIGNPVLRLRRVAIGGLQDPYLRQGSWRELAEEEVTMLLGGAQLTPPPRRKGAPKRPLASKPGRDRKPGERKPFSRKSSDRKGGGERPAGGERGKGTSPDRRGGQKGDRSRSKPSRGKSPRSKSPRGRR